MKTIRVAAGSAAAALAVSAFAFAPTATAADAELCDGAASQVTAHNILVKKDAACYLSDVKLTGSVKLEKGASLVTENVEILGAISMAEGSFLDALDSKLTGGVSGDGAQMYLASSKVLGNVRLTNERDMGTYVAFTDSELWGFTRVAGSELFVGETDVYSGLLAVNGIYADIYNSRVFGTTIVSDNRGGATFCGNEVSGRVDMRFNAGLNIGDAGRGLCDGDNMITGRMVVSSNTDYVRMSDTHVSGRLEGFANDPAPMIGENVSASYARGQFSSLNDKNRRSVDLDMTEAPEGDNASTRVDNIRERRAADRAAAIAAAQAAGEAFGDQG